MSYRTTVQLVNALGSDYDAEVHKWKQSLQYGLRDLTPVSKLLLFSIICNYFLIRETANCIFKLINITIEVP